MSICWKYFTDSFSTNGKKTRNISGGSSKYQKNKIASFFSPEVFPFGSE